MNNNPKRTSHFIQRFGLPGLALISAFVVYAAFFIILKADFLAPENPYFRNDLIALVISIFLLLVLPFVWKAVYRQFKKDRTVFGYAPERNGYMVFLEIIVEAIITFVLVAYLHWHPALFY